MRRTTRHEQRRIRWPHLISLRALTYFGVLFFVEFLLGPGVVKGEVNVGEVLFMLFVMAGLSVVFFSRSAMGLDKSFEFEDE